MILPAANLYKPVWEYDAKTFANDLTAHVVYGVTTATATAAACQQRRMVTALA